MNGIFNFRPQGLPFFIIVVLALLAAFFPVRRCDAVIPAAAKSDPLYAKGYLKVTYYSGVYSNNSNPTSTRAGLQQAIDDAYENDLVAYFPSGTYQIDNQLLCHADVTNGEPGSKHHVLIGSTTGSRPLIKLSPGASGFSNEASPKAMLDFKCFVAGTQREKPVSSYYEMLRGIDFDCSGKAGAYGVYFPAAQCASLENVKVTATNAYAGFVGLPGAEWGAVNIEVEGGQYGIDMVSASATAGTMVAGAILRNQTKSAVTHKGFVPFTLVGFEIVTPSGSTQPAITIPGGWAHHASALNLIDGSITCTTPPSNAAIVNTTDKGQNLYIRNVSIKGTNNLIKSGDATQPKVTSTGTWKRIDEYVYTDQSGQDNVNRISRSMLDGSLSTTGQPVVAVTPSAPEPAWDLVLRHVWASLPSVDDTDYVDAFALGIKPGTVSSAAFQDLINTHRKIFLRPGVYSLNSPGITLKNDTILFGAARHLTRIETVTNWLPKSEVQIVKTSDDANATTYIGDLSIGVNTANQTNSVFCALDWQAGAGSMVHIGRPYRFTAGGTAGGARSLMRIRNSGGGRWFFAGAGEGGRTENPAYRHLDVEGTSQPLWIYGLNLEHARGDMMAEFHNVSNLRIYGVKSEFEGQNTAVLYVPVVTFNNTLNAAMFGHGALRHTAGSGRGCVEVLGTSNRILASLVVPQNGGGPSGLTVLDKTNGTFGATYPDCVSLFKRGQITPEDETLMTHPHIGYGSVAAQWGGADIGTVLAKGSAGYGSGVYTVRGSGTDIFGSADSFYFLSQALNGDGEISARVLTQQTVGVFPKVGVMIRETTAANSRFVHGLIQKTAVGTGAGVRLQYRAQPGENVVTVAGANGPEVAPYWLKLRRKNNTFSFCKSVDGLNWGEPVGSQTITMQNAVRIGLAVCGNLDGKLNTATFDNVKISALPETNALEWGNYR